MNLLTFSVPLYRSDSFGKHFASILNQNNQNFDLIVSNDGPSNSITDLITTRYPRAKYFKNEPPKGEIENSNSSIGAAQTEYVCLYHDDDFLLSTFTDHVLDFLERNPETDLLYTGRVVVNENDNVIAHQLVNKGRSEYSWDSHDVLDTFVLGKKLGGYSVPLMTPGLIFRKDLFEKVGGFDKNVDTHCDLDLMLKLLAVSNQVGYINKPLYVTKVWYGNSGRTKSAESGTIYFAIKKIYSEFATFCKQKNIHPHTYSKNNILKNYVTQCTNLNGPLLWLKLRNTASWYEITKLQIRILRDMIQISDFKIRYSKLLITILISMFVPKYILRLAQQILLPYYLEKK